MKVTKVVISPVGTTHAELVINYSDDSVRVVHIPMNKFAHLMKEVFNEPTREKSN